MPATTTAAPMAASSAPPINRNPEVEAMLWNQHASMNTSINSSNVGNMQMAWKYDTPNPVSHTPLVDGTGVYFGDWGGMVYKLDRTGKLLWKKEVEQPKTMWPWHGFAGTGTLGDGKLYEASVEGNAFGIDPATGNVLWKTKFVDDPEAGDVGTLLYHDGLVYIGVQSVEEPMTHMKKDFKPDFRGQVVALRASDGSIAWRRELVQAPQNGVPMWSSFALDPDLNMLYFTTGNNYTGESSKMSDAIVAVDAKTGEVKWFDQVTSHDVWTKADQNGPDYDFAGGAQLFVANVNGQPTRLVGAGQKSGTYLVYNAVTGEKVWNTNIGYGGVHGGMHGDASIGKEMVFAWSNNGYAISMPPGKHPITVKGVNAQTGAPQWVINHAQPASVTSGYLSNDVYLVGSLDGTIQAYRATDGKQLMQTKVPAPILSQLRVEGNTLFLSGGVTAMLKDWADKGDNGVYAYSVK